jgi:DNA-binding NarL/FixJ family response regulator
MKETILIVEDHDEIRQALCERLKIAFPHYQILQTTTHQEFVDMVLSKSPRLVVVNIGPPVNERLETIQHIKSIQPATKIIVWTIQDWNDYRADAMAAGASAYILQEESNDNFLSTLRSILSGTPDTHQSQAA